MAFCIGKIKLYFQLVSIVYKFGMQRLTPRSDIPNCGDCTAFKSNLNYAELFIMFYYQTLDKICSRQILFNQQSSVILSNPCLSSLPCFSL